MRLSGEEKSETLVRISMHMKYPKHDQLVLSETIIRTLPVLSVKHVVLHHPLRNIVVSLTDV